MPLLILLLVKSYLRLRMRCGFRNVKTASAVTGISMDVAAARMASQHAQDKVALYLPLLLMAGPLALLQLPRKPVVMIANFGMQTLGPVPVVKGSSTSVPAFQSEEGLIVHPVAVVRWHQQQVTTPHRLNRLDLLPILLMENWLSNHPLSLIMRRRQLPGYTQMPRPPDLPRDRDPREPSYVISFSKVTVGLGLLVVFRMGSPYCVSAI